MQPILVLAFLTAFGVSLVLTAIIRKVAARVGFVDTPAGHKSHRKPTPYGGGIAIVLTACLVLFGAAFLAREWRQHPSLFPVPPAIAEDVRRAADTLPLLLCILGGGLGMALFGLWDDIRASRPLQKLIAQFLVATLMVFSSGVRVSAFIPWDWAQAAITILWIVLLTNSFNLLDNMDGLSGTVAFICAGALLVLALQTMQFFIAGFVLTLAGAVLGFLFFNLPPAGIFLGDTGSLFIGYMLATATALTTFMTREQVNPIFPIFVPLIIFAVPLYDTLSVVAIRLRHKRPIMAGDQNHFSHRMGRLGMGPRRVLLTVALMTLATALGATVPYGSSTWQALVPAVQALAILAVIMQLELVSSKVHYGEPGPPAEP